MNTASSMERGDVRPDSPLTDLLTRISSKPVRAPAPSDAQLAHILQTAMSAPDHGKRQPWRFCLIRDAAVARLGELALGAARTAGVTMTPQKEASVRTWLAQVPLLIAIACRLDHSDSIPEQERLLATGAAVMNILNAAHMLGYGAYWSTGLGTYLDEVPQALGFDPLDYRFMGFLALGTPIEEPLPVTRPDHRQFVSEWTGLA